MVEEGILTFTQAELIAGEVEFVDDGDQDAPSFSVTVNDGEFDSETLPVNILDFINTNDDPVAVPDSGMGFETDENTPFTTASVVANDTDVDPDDVANLEVIEIEGQAVGVGDIELASGAIVSLAGNGTINYDPNGAFQLPLGESTEDSFTYTVSDGNGGTDTTTVTVTINGVNDAPIAVDDEGEGFSTLDNESFTMTPLINDEDPDGDNFRIIKINDATVNPGETVSTDSATAVLNEDGSITYMPAEAFRLASVGETIPDSFTYTITDDNGGESTATVNIVVNGANEAPVAVDDLSFATVEGTNLLLEVLLNDTDIDFNDELTIESVDTTGLSGSVINNGDSLTYVPSLSLIAGETALETFTYTMTDGIAVSESATVQVLVTGVNDAPIAGADSGTGFTTNEATAFTTANVLANDSDPEGAALSLVGLDTSGTQGLVTNNGDGTFNYDPNGVFNTLAQGRTATDTFSYTVSDDLGLTTTTTVTIGITGLLSEFVDFEQQLQLQNLAAIVPGDTVGFLPLAQLYDESFYLAQNPDVAGLVTAGVLSSGYQHFVAFGINEGRNPSVLYNESFYLNQNPDIAGAVANGSLASGLSHFLNFGHLEGRDPSAFFDESDYLLNNPDVALGVAQGSLASGFQHYILLGADEGRGPNLSLFDEAFYLANNPDVVGIDAYAHFTLFGQFEGRQPSALYNEASYLSLHGDIANAVNAGTIANGFQHYEAFGRFEGREVFA
ncbi:MAG: tandem-95 repeat protein [Leptolyngbya sp. SIOISBB]|nr:tandem-95 repeat protein [Leptolyngbya sp. SIOISBB]